jgi:RNA polymerase sigma-70 factor (ECF subfamily)
MPAHEELFIAAFDTHVDELFRHASFRLSDRERARDLVQDTYLKAWDQVQSGAEIRHWRGFLYRILNNLIIDEYRRAKDTSLDAILDDDPTALSEKLSSDGRDAIEERLNDELLIERIRGLIPELPEAYRVAVTLRYVDGFTPKEIAELLDISENVASVRIHRAVAKLREWCLETP